MKNYKLLTTVKKHTINKKSNNSNIRFVYTSIYHYSRTSRKRIPKMQRLNGRLLGVVVYKNRTTGAFFREEVLRDIPFMEDNLLHAISKLPHVQSMLSLKFVVYSKQHSAPLQRTQKSENASSGRLQEVKNNGKSLTVRPKKWLRSLTGGKALTGGSTVFTAFQ